MHIADKSLVCEPHSVLSYKYNVLHHEKRRVANGRVEWANKPAFHRADDKKKRPLHISRFQIHIKTAIKIPISLSLSVWGCSDWRPADQRVRFSCIDVSWRGTRRRKVEKQREVVRRELGRTSCDKCGRH